MLISKRHFCVFDRTAHLCILGCVACIVYSESQKFYTPRFSGSFFPAAENFKLKLLHACCTLISMQNYQVLFIISNFDKVMPYEVRSSGEFLDFT